MPTAWSEITLLKMRQDLIYRQDVRILEGKIRQVAEVKALVLIRNAFDRNNCAIATRK